MKKYSIYILIGLIVVLGVLIFLFANPRKESKITEKTTGALFFPNFKIEEVSKLEANSVILEKKDKIWEVVDGEQRYPADQNLVDQALKMIAELKQGSLISKNSAKHVQLGVDKDNGLNVVMKDSTGKELANFYIGNDGQAFQTQYVRRVDSDQVYLIIETLKPTFQKNVTDWREKQILTLNQNEITSLILDYPDQELQLEKGSDGWQMKAPEEFTVAPEVISDLLTTLSNLSASGFATAEEAAEFENNQILTVIIKRGQSEDKLILAQKEENYFARHEGNAITFKLSQFTAEKLTKKVEDFKTK